MVAVSGHARRLDQPLFAQVSQVTGPWISRAPIVVSQITTGDHSECANGRERSRFGAAQGVFAIAVANQLALRSAGQVHVACERVPSLPIAFTMAPGMAPISEAFSRRRHGTRHGTLPWSS
jgi:hypothetical protein